MKNFIIGFALLATLSACNKTIYTHQQVMLNYRTKSDVVKQFGSPDEIAKNAGMVVWMYNCDEKSNGDILGTSYGAESDSLGMHAPVVATFTLHKRYVQFYFDQQGNVLSYDSRGVDLAKKKPDPIATTLLVTGLVVGSVAILYAATFKSVFRLGY